MLRVHGFKRKIGIEVSGKMSRCSCIPDLHGDHPSLGTGSNTWVPKLLMSSLSRDKYNIPSDIWQ